MTELSYAEQKTWNGMKDLPPPIDFSECPNNYVAGAIERYFEYALPPGSFTMALLEGNLYSAIAHADHTNKEILVDLVYWVRETLPTDCYGSKEKVQAWLKSGGAMKDE